MQLHLAETQKRIAEIIEDFGVDYIYPRSGYMARVDNVVIGTMGSCRYFESDGQPSCIVGHLLHRIDAMPITPDGMWNTGDVDGLRVLVPMDDDVFTYLSELQERQDAGTPWGRANDQALLSLEQAHIGS